MSIDPYFNVSMTIGVSNQSSMDGTIPSFPLTQLHHKAMNRRNRLIWVIHDVVLGVTLSLTYFF